jgi:hypothetical protein
VAGLLGFTSLGIAFTSHGPLSYNGALGYYLGMIIWFWWLNSHAYYNYRALGREMRTANAAASERVPDVEAPRTLARPSLPTVGV